MRWHLAGGAYSAPPYPLAGKGGGAPPGRGRKGRGREGKGKGYPPQRNSWLWPCQFPLPTRIWANSVQAGGHYLPSPSRHCSSISVRPTASRCWHIVKTLSSIVTAFCQMTSHLPRRCQCFVVNWRHTCFSDHTRTLLLCHSGCLKFSLLRPL